jgi:uncharacterized protein YdaU (DUF1376 family)
MINGFLDVFEPLPILAKVKRRLRRMVTYISEKESFSCKELAEHFELCPAQALITLHSFASPFLVCSRTTPRRGGITSTRTPDMGKPPWVRFFPSDWLAGTRGMSAAETGVYITLVAMLYESQSSIRNDETRLSRLCGLPVASYRKIVSALVEQDKITLSDGMLWNMRVGVELQIRIEKTEAASKSAKAKWSKKIGRAHV